MGFCCAYETLDPTCQEDESLLWVKLSIGAWWDHFSQWSRGCIPVTRDVKNHCLHNLGRGLQKCFGKLKQRQGTLKKEAMFYCAGTDSMDSCPKAEPQEQRDLTLYTLASR
jgi:hypothetical protein